MSAPIRDDGNDSEQSGYSPPQFSEQPRMPAALQLYLSSTPTVPSSTAVDENRRTESRICRMAGSHSGATTTGGGLDYGASRADCDGGICCGCGWIVNYLHQTTMAGRACAAQRRFRRHHKLSDLLTDFRRITCQRITHSRQPQRLQRPLARRRLQVRRRKKRRSHRARKNRAGVLFGG